MKSILTALALATTLAGVSAAHADPLWRGYGPPAQEVRLRERAHAFHELREARERFYSSPHSRWEVRRFERWYHHRHEELEREFRHARYWR